MQPKGTPPSIIPYMYMNGELSLFTQLTANTKHGYSLYW